MTETAWLLCGLAVPFALANWWSRTAHRQVVEWITKPTVTALILGVALAVDPTSTSMRTAFVIGLSFCLIGDIALMLPADLFVVGLGAFLIGHIAFVVGFLLPGHPNVALANVGILVVAVAILIVGRRILRSVFTGSPQLGLPVSMYLLVISAMVVAAFSHGVWWGIAGAAVFFASDTLLAVNRFVQPFARAEVAIMITYHLALFGLAFSLFG